MAILHNAIVILSTALTILCYNFYMNFAEILKKLRYNTGETQKVLSEKIGYSQSIISEWEKGTKEPTAQAIIALAKHYNLTTDYILGFDNNRDESFDKDEQLLINAYRAMSPGKKKALFGMLDIDFAESEGKKA